MRQTAERDWFLGGGFEGVASLIEQQIYGSYDVHALLSITLAERRVVVVLAPWSDLAAVTVAVFNSADLRHVWAAHDTRLAEFALPWDIIGFDSADLGGGRWEFVINCINVEFCWRSAWPVAEQRHGEA